MRPSTLIKILLAVVILLAGTSFYAADKAFEYRGTTHTQIKVVRNNAIVYGRFDPDRSSSYTCDVQDKVTKDGVGMICNSPDGNVAIYCTTTSGNSSEYFC